MPRTRKHRWWDVTATIRVVKEPQKFSGRFHSKTYGGACHKAFKKWRVGKPLPTPYGGFEGVQAEPVRL